MSSFDAKLKRILLLRRAVGLVWESAHDWTVASVGLLVIQSLLPLASLYLMKLMVDAVTASLQSHNPDLSTVLRIIAALGGVTLAGAVAGSLASLVGEAQGQAVTDHVQSVIQTKSVQIDLGYYESSKYYDSLHRAQQEGSSRPTRIVNNLVQVGQSGLSLLALIGLLLSLHWIIAAILVVAAVPGALVRVLYSQQLYTWQRQRTSTERRAWYFNWMLVGEAFAKEIRLFDLGELFIQRYRDVRARLRGERLRLASRRALIELVMQTGTILAIYGALAYIASQAVLGAITLGDLVMYYQAFQRGQSYLREILGGLASLYEDSLFLTNLYEFLDLKPGIAAPRTPRALPRPIQRGITFDHVRFAYDGCDTPVLADISLTIEPGEHIALVGANGAGKTTLVKLLTRLYDPTGGCILLDGTDLRQFDPAELRRRMSVVFQDYAHYYLTARENIWLGNTLLAPDSAQVAAAAGKAGADALIRRLPQGYDTPLGKWFDEGAELSIGEWQKIALARAFVRDADIIVLDEPTSSLDAASEFQVFQTFRQLAEGKTTILISHRFSSVRMADRIYMLQDGRITEAGSHMDLLKHGREYARLFEMQAENYR